MIDRSKERYNRFREVAKQIHNTPFLKIPDHASVQICEGGAYVDAHVFIPDSFLDEDWDKINQSEKVNG